MHLPTKFILLVLGLGFAACTPADDASSNNQNQMPDTLKTLAEKTAPEPANKEFKGFANQYSDLHLPILIEDVNLVNYWTDHPERKIPVADLKAFLTGTKDFPPLSDDPRFATFGQMKLGSGNLLLLTYQFEYGDHIFATTFNHEGKVLSGKKIVSIPEVPEANSMTAVLDGDGSLTLTHITPLEFDEEGLPTDYGYEQEAWQITDGGNFEKK